MSSSRTLLTATASVLLLGGLTMLFAPDLVAGLLVGRQATEGWTVQLLGAAWCGAAAMNWMSRGSVIGGIYGRPLVASNLVHFLMAALILTRAALGARLPLGMFPVLAAVALLAGTYGLRMYSDPLAAEGGIQGPR